MTISANLNRPKAVPVVEVPLTVGVGNPATDGSTWTQYIALNNVDPPEFVRTCAIEESSSTVVVSAGHGIRVGDVVTGTGIPVSTTVTAVDVTSITLSEDAEATNAEAELTFNPPAVDARLIGVLGEVIISGTSARIRIRLYRSTGLNVAGGTDTTVIGDMGNSIGEVTGVVNLDTFLSNLRIPRVNS